MKRSELYDFYSYIYKHKRNLLDAFGYMHPLQLPRGYKNRSSLKSSATAAVHTDTHNNDRNNTSALRDLPLPLFTKIMANRKRIVFITKLVKQFCSPVHHHRRQVRRFLRSRAMYYHLRYAASTFAHAVTDPPPVIAISPIGTIPTSAKHHPSVKACRFLYQLMNKILLGKPNSTVMEPSDIFTLDNKSGYITARNMLLSDKGRVFDDMRIKTKAIFSAAQSIYTTAKLTEPHKDAKAIFRVVTPGINFAHRLATMEYILNNIHRLPTSDIFIIRRMVTDYITHGARELPKQLLSTQQSWRVNDGDIIQLLEIVKSVAEQRFTAMTINPVPKACTCRAKCIGPIGDKPFIERMVNEQFHTLSATTPICPKTRLSLIHKTNTKEHPKHSISITNPGVVKCSLDGCTAATMLQLYTLKRASTTAITYKHKFYSSNSVVFQDPLYNNTTASASCNYFGMCFGGSRKCYHSVAGKINSGRQHPLSHPFTDINAWYTCPTCKDNYSPHIVGVSDTAHYGTCIPTAYAALATPKEHTAIHQMCIGCCASVLCFHFITNILTRALSDSDHFDRVWITLRKSRRLQTLVRDKWRMDYLSREGSIPTNPLCEASLPKT